MLKALKRWFTEMRRRYFGRPGSTVAVTPTPTPSPTPTPTPSPTLATLSLSASTFTRGSATSGTILGATALSAITASGLPSGLTINGAARTWAWDGTGSGSSSGTFTLTETLLGATNTPHANTISYSISAASTSPLALGVNMPTPSWYIYNPAFMDTAYSSPGFIAAENGGFSGSTTNNPIPDANRDANGNVKSLPGGEAGARLVCQLPTTLAQRKLTWQSALGGSNHGCATMTMPQGGSGVVVDLVNRSVTYTPTNIADGTNSNEPQFVYTPVSGTDYPINFIDRPVVDSGAVLTPEFTSLIPQACSASPVIRFMDWTTVNRNNSPLADSPTGKTISSITFVGTLATLTTSTPHGLLGNGTPSGSASITTTGQTPATYSVANAYVNVISPTQFQYTMGGTPTGNATVMGSYTVGDADAQHTNLHYPVLANEPGVQFGEPIYTSTNRNKNKADAEWHDGVMLESILSLCTALSAIPYYPVAPNADSTFYTDVATVCATSAAATGKPLYQSVGNEPWNFQFAWAHQLRNEANLRGSLGDALASCRLIDTVGVTLSGAQTVDGVAVANGDRVLRAIPNSSTNGPYIVNTGGAWSRAADVVAFRSIWLVTSGLTQANTSWFVSTQGAITLGTTALTIAQIKPWMRYVETVITVANAFRTAFASAGVSSLLNVVAEWQNYGSTTIWDDMAAFVGPTDWAKVTHLAVAPYYGDNNQMGIAVGFTGPDATLKAATSADIDATLGHMVTHVTYAVANGKKLITYEGGVTTNLSDITYKTAWAHSSNAYDLELRFLQQMELRAAPLQTGGLIHCQYSSCYPLVGSNFWWGLVETITQTRSKATTPKLQAHTDFLAGTRALAAVTGSFTIPFGATNGTVVGTATRSVYGSTLALSNSSGGLFAINNATGVVTVANAALITPGNNYALAVDETYSGTTLTTNFTVPATGNGTAYRYYRLLWQNSNDGTNAGAATVNLAETVGGADTATGQTYADSDHFSPSFVGANLFDGNIATEYASSGSAMPHWVSVDYGPTAGNWKKINQITITSRGGGAANQAPTPFKLQGSTDNFVTSTVDIIVKTPVWTAADNQVQTFTT